MPALDAEELLACWERGRDAPPPERLLILLDAVGVEAPEALAVGEANRLILALRAETFGARFEGRATCPACDEACTFEFDVAALAASLESPQRARSLSVGALEALVRPLRVEDLLVVEQASSTDARTADAALTTLVGRCAESVRNAGQPVAVESLDDASLSALADELIAADRGAVITIALRCPGCDIAWLAPFDPAMTLWTELDVAARRLLGEIHLLATQYGWRERDVLSLTPARREAYVQLCTGAEW